MKGIIMLDKMKLMEKVLAVSKEGLKQMDVAELPDKSKRIVRGWATVEIKDKQGEVIPISEMKRAMLDIMINGRTVTDMHSNRVVGEILNYEVKEHPKTKATGILITYRIYDGNEFYDKVWSEIKDGTRTGLSFGGFAGGKSFDEDFDAESLSGVRGFEVASVDNPANPESLNVEGNLFAKSMNKEEVAKTTFNLVSIRDKEFVEAVFPDGSRQIVALSRTELGKGMDGFTDEEIMKIESEMEKQNNPWAICTESVGREDKEKYESCVRHLKERMGIKSIGKEMTMIEAPNEREAERMARDMAARSHWKLIQVHGQPGTGRYYIEFEPMPMRKAEVKLKYKPTDKVSKINSDGGLEMKKAEESQEDNDRKPSDEEEDEDVDKIELVARVASLENKVNELLERTAGVAKNPAEKGSGGEVKPPQEADQGDKPEGNKVNVPKEPGLEKMIEAEVEKALQKKGLKSESPRAGYSDIAKRAEATDEFDAMKIATGEKKVDMMQLSELENTRVEEQIRKVLGS